jgi:sensor histidine kinase regulating citrate/malate metabolism
LFVNYADESGRDREVQPDIKVFIAEEGDQVRIEITDINGSPCLWSERLFESLWSEKGDGLGIGLYLMKQLITEAGDTLQAFTPAQEPMIFVISLPRSLQIKSTYYGD